MSRQESKPWAHSVKELRQRLGVSQAELADKLGVAPKTVTNWEKGRTSPGPDLRATLERLAQAQASDFAEEDDADDAENFGEDCACFLCGCTEQSACEGGCHWDDAALVHEDLTDKDMCSRCVDQLLAVKKIFPELGGPGKVMDLVNLAERMWGDAAAYTTSQGRAQYFDRQADKARAKAQAAANRGA